MMRVQRVTKHNKPVKSELWPKQVFHVSSDWEAEKVLLYLLFFLQRDAFLCWLEEKPLPEVEGLGELKCMSYLELF